MSHLRFYLTTQRATDDLPPLPDRCPVCGGGLVITYDLPNGNAGGGCDQQCGWTFKRSVIDRRI